MKLCEKNGVKFFTFENIEKMGIVNHCFSTRIGGVSEGKLSSLNLGYNRGDNRESVTENFKRICEANHMDYKKMVFGKQIHDTKIKTVTKNNCGCGIVFESQIDGFDGYITNEPEVVLVTFHADCVPLFFVDKAKKVIGLSHSGWKGTVRKMVKATVQEMQRVFGCNPTDIVAAIGPSIGGCCFQVDKPVVDEFINKIPFASEYIRNDESLEGKYKIDLWGINRDLMIEAGILPENIEITDYCTMCHDDLFYSHRKMGEERGSLAAFLSLKS
ncbi:MAG: peptidoglycan editing factor PgeF [Anaerotignaceae bacterium]